MLPVPVVVGSTATTYRPVMNPQSTIGGIPRVDLQQRGPRRRRFWWALGGPIYASRTGLAVWRKLLAPLEARVVTASGGRLKLNPAVPIVVLTSTGARTGQSRETPLAYFTDGDAVILIASNYGSGRHPGWYYNLRAHPECRLHIGPRGGTFRSTEVTGEERDRLYGLAVDRLAHVFALHDERSGEQWTIPVLRLTPT